MTAAIAILLALAGCTSEAAPTRANDPAPARETTAPAPSEPRALETTVSREVAQRGFTNGLALLEQIAAVPGPNEPGIRIGDLPDDGVLTAIGVREGDVITHLAGHSVLTPAGLATALQELEATAATRPSIGVDLIRSGEPIALRCRLTGAAIEVPTEATAPSPLPRVTPIPQPEGFDRLTPAERAERAARRVSDTEYTIDRAYAAAILEGDGARPARVVPAMREEGPIGVQLLGVAQGSLFSRMGLANGDIVQSINGHAIDDPEDGLALYTELRAADTVEVVLERGGAPLTLRYVIR